jgi:hypothetical protein
VKMPAATPAAAALKIRFLSMAASVAGQAEGVARVVRGVVDRHRVREPGAVDDENPECEREDSRPFGELAGRNDGS